MRTDVVKMYRDIHGWVGIISGLALFIAFYAGAITMFEEPLRRWASAPTVLAPPPSLDRTPELIAKAIAAHPEAAKSYQIHIVTGPERPARMSWTVESGEHEPGTTYHASLGPDGALQISEAGPSPVAEFIDILHQQVGLPLDHEIAMPVMGAIALLYAIALVSGTIVLLPSLVKDLFAMRIGRNVKRMWLDFHNVLGLFSLPFHIVMALSAVVFAFHDQFYDAQLAATRLGVAEVERPKGPPPTPVTPITPGQAVARLAAQAPDFAPITLGYSNGPRGQIIRVNGDDPRHVLRGATFGVAIMNAGTGDLVGTDYLPGKQSAWFAVVTSFFALHFGNFGGATVRWAYFLLGMGGAILFYTGNLLWVESRRKRERKAGLTQQTRSTRILGALTVGVCTGCIAGISITVAAAKALPAWIDPTPGLHSAIYYAVFLAMVGWALARGAARAGRELLLASAAACVAIPLLSIFAAAGGAGWNHAGATVLVDVTALVGTMLFVLLARRAGARAGSIPRDSVWHANVDAVSQTGS